VAGEQAGECLRRRIVGEQPWQDRLAEFVESLGYLS
jgi:hypothetical protein